MNKMVYMRHVGVKFMHKKSFKQAHVKSKAMNHMEGTGILAWCLSVMIHSFIGISQYYEYINHNIR